MNDQGFSSRFCEAALMALLLLCLSASFTLVNVESASFALAVNSVNDNISPNKGTLRILSIAKPSIASLIYDKGLRDPVGQGKEQITVPGRQITDEKKIQILETYSQLPLYFIENQGQVDRRVRFYAKGPGHTAFFTAEGIYLSLLRNQESDPPNAQDRAKAGLKKTAVAQESEIRLNEVAKGSLHRASNPQSFQGKCPSWPKAQIIKLTPLGMRKGVKIVADEPQQVKANYFIGKDRKQWKTNIGTYRSVVYREVYPGIDLKFYGNNRQLEYDIILKPGADPSIVRLSYQGTKRLRISGDGDLLIDLKSGNIIQKRPYIYQEIDGKRVEVEGRYEIRNAKPENGNPKLACGFEIGSYDKKYPLIIDPVLVYSTYLGGTSNDDYGYGIAVDSSGNAYVTGYTLSFDFPIESPLDDTIGGGIDAFVTKLDATGSALVYSTYLGGGNSDQGNDIAVDSSGNAYITGTTQSFDFPTESPFDDTIGGGIDAFVTKLDATGSALVYSTYLGGGNIDQANDIAVDSSGNAYVTGYTLSFDFPTESPFDDTIGGAADAFVTKIAEVDEGDGGVDGGVDGGGGGGGCFIATAAYGSPMESHVIILKDFRDTCLLPCALGRIFVRTYNKYSPPLARFISKHEILKVTVRIGLMPLVAVRYATLYFGPTVTLSMLVGLLVLPIFLFRCYRRKARSYRADN